MPKIKTIIRDIETVKTSLDIRYDSGEKRFTIGFLPDTVKELYYSFRKERKEEGYMTTHHLKSGFSIYDETQDAVYERLTDFLEYVKDNAGEKTDVILISLHLTSSDSEIEEQDNYSRQEESISYNFKIATQQTLSNGAISYFLDGRMVDHWKHKDYIIIPHTPENVAFCESFRAAMIELMKKIKSRLGDSDTLLKSIKSKINLLS
jgi:hypothetical protein